MKRTLLLMLLCWAAIAVAAQDTVRVGDDIVEAVAADTMAAPVPVATQEHMPKDKPSKADSVTQSIPAEDEPVAVEEPALPSNHSTLFITLIVLALLVGAGAGTFLFLRFRKGRRKIYVVELSEKDALVENFSVGPTLNPGIVRRDFRHGCFMLYQLVELPEPSEDTVSQTWHEFVAEYIRFLWVHYYQWKDGSAAGLRAYINKHQDVFERKLRVPLLLTMGKDKVNESHRLYDDGVHKACYIPLPTFTPAVRKVDTSRQHVIELEDRIAKLESDLKRKTMPTPMRVASDPAIMKQLNDEQQKRIALEKRVEQLTGERDAANAMLAKAEKQLEQAKKEASHADWFRTVPGLDELKEPIVSIRDAVLDLHEKQMKLCQKVLAKTSLADAEKDNFNYYFLSITNKYIKVLSDNHVEALELQAGLSLYYKCEHFVLPDGSMDNGIAKKVQQGQDVRVLLHRQLGPLCGAAIVLSDDLLSLSRLCPAAVSADEVKPFAAITEALLKAAKQLGYQPAYVKLFTPYSAYPDVEVKKAVSLEGTRKNDVVEVLQMAVNYGTEQHKTLVSANI